MENSLACSYMCKNSNIKGYPAYEITLLFLYAYGSYARGSHEAVWHHVTLLCGIIMAHYNSYNLSKPSQVTAEHIFKSFALVSEFFVFLYMGMGVCAGQFGRWDFTFVFSPSLSVWWHVSSTRSRLVGSLTKGTSSTERIK